MKFVVQEYLVDGEFFFSVDTHDDLDVRPDTPDYDAWQELKRYNRELKAQIEAAWRAAGLPTHDDLRAPVEGLAPVEREEQKRARLLLVDDEADVARGSRRCSRARGYEVELAYDGRAGARAPGARSAARPGAARLRDARARRRGGARPHARAKPRLASCRC